MFLDLSQAAIWLTADTVIWPGGLSTDGADQSAGQIHTNTNEIHN